MAAIAWHSILSLINMFLLLLLPLMKAHRLSSEREVCTVAQEDADCISTYGIPPEEWKAPCCDEDQGFTCMYSYKGHRCGKKKGWYPANWVNHLSSEAAISAPSGSIPYWQLAESIIQTHRSGNSLTPDSFSVRYGPGSAFLQKLTDKYDWFAFADIWWAAPRRNTPAAEDPGKVIKKYAGGSAARPTAFSDVNGLIAGKKSAGTAGSSQWQFDPSYEDGVPHQKEVLQYAVDLADALNALGVTEPADGRKLWRGGWYSQADLRWVKQCLKERLPLAHAFFMSTSLSADHAKEFVHPMYCKACVAQNNGFPCNVCPGSDQVAVLFKITSKHGKELKEIANNLWEQEFIFLPHTLLRVASVTQMPNDPVEGKDKTEWYGRPLKGRPGKMGGYLVNEQPTYYLIELVDFRDNEIAGAFQQLQKLRTEGIGPH
mmetsp:Transcript_18546/g.36387  ORF Transcript_18546/g.36387 Transcript_18546/m.36387 type:complete len:430 (+) Transcript_18546:58-1347(+)